MEIFAGKINRKKRRQNIPEQGTCGQKPNRMKQKVCLGSINWTGLTGVTGPRMSGKEFVFYVTDNGEPLKAFEQEGMRASEQHYRKLTWESRPCRKC